MSLRLCHHKEDVIKLSFRLTLIRKIVMGLWIIFRVITGKYLEYRGRKIVYLTAFVFPPHLFVGFESEFIASILRQTTDEQSVIFSKMQQRRLELLEQKLCMSRLIIK